MIDCGLRIDEELSLIKSAIRNPQSAINMDWQTTDGEINMIGGNNASGLFEQLAEVLRGSVFSMVIGPALSSLGTQGVMEQIENSANAMTDEQRTGVARTLLNGLGSSGVDLNSLLGKLGINLSIAGNPAEANAEDLAKLAAHAHENDHGLFNRAMEFYNEYPALVQTLGAIAIAAIVNYLTESKRV